MFTEANIIAVITRKDCGQLELKGQAARIARRYYKVPVFLTASIQALIESVVGDESARVEFDYLSILNDILSMSRIPKKVFSSQEHSFEVSIAGTNGGKLHTLYAAIGPTEYNDPRPAITIMMQEDL